MIKNILLDLDDTIFDFKKAESLALSKTLVEYGLEPTKEVCERYSEINLSQWKLLELGQLTRAEVLVNRFHILFREFGIHAPAEQVSVTYANYLGQGHFYMEGALEGLEKLAKDYRLYIISNGTNQVQQSRLASANIFHLFHGIFISEVIGFEKPSPYFFKACFEQIPDFKPEETIVVGDSLSSDIKGGILAGLRTVWMHRPFAKKDPKIIPSYQVQSWEEFLAYMPEIDLYSDLLLFRPYNEQEERDKALILHSLDSQKDIFDRSNRLAHMTASAWVMNQDHTKVLMAFHNIYHSWSWLGGHADGERWLLKTALREVQEESHISRVRPVSNQIFSLEVLTVDGHMKRGEYVSSHLHLNVTYLLEADDTDEISNAPDENSAVAWFSPREAVEASTEPWFQKWIYSKLNKKAGLE